MQKNRKNLLNYVLGKKTINSMVNRPCNKPERCYRCRYKGIPTHDAKLLYFYLQKGYKITERIINSSMICTKCQKRYSDWVEVNGKGVNIKEIYDDQFTQK